MTYKTYEDCEPAIKELMSKARSRQPATARFLVLYETFPKNVWDKAVKKGIISPHEYQGMMLILKQYRELQAKSAISAIQSP
jgi:hypothetical protein